MSYGAKFCKIVNELQKNTALRPSKGWRNFKIYQETSVLVSLIELYRNILLEVSLKFILRKISTDDDDLKERKGTKITRKILDLLGERRGLMGGWIFQQEHYKLSVNKGYLWQKINIRSTEKKMRLFLLGRKRANERKIKFIWKNKGLTGKN